MWKIYENPVQSDPKMKTSYDFKNERYPFHHVLPIEPTLLKSHLIPNTSYQLNIIIGNFIRVGLRIDFVRDPKSCCLFA